MSLPAESKLQHLEKVFASFTQVSTALNDSYGELEKQVVCLNRELAVARSSRIKVLRDKEQLAVKLSTLMDALPGGILVTDHNDKVIQENPAIAEIFGHSAISKQWQSFLEENVSQYTQHLQTYSLKNHRHISISSRKFGEQQGQIILITDITDNIKLQLQVNQDKKLREMGEMTGRLAHQVRTPISSAILYLSQLKNSNHDQNSMTSYVGKIRNRLEQVEKLINSMLHYIRNGANEREQCSLEDIINSVVADYSPLVSELKGNIRFQCNTRHPYCLGNPFELKNALSNLVDNAISVTPQNPRIFIELERELNTLIIRIYDNGPGIDPEIKDRIFDSFFSTRSDGTGLGLAIVLSIVKAHNGEISVFSTPDSGACFEIRLQLDHEVYKKENSLWFCENRPGNYIAVKESI